MATSKCIKCDSTRFEMKLNDHIQGSAYKMNFIQCASCGGVVGVTDYFNTSHLIKELAKKLGVRI